MTRDEKTIILNAIKNVADRLEEDMNVTESPMTYVKDDTRRKVYLEVYNYLNDNIITDEDKKVKNIKQEITSSEENSSKAKK